MWRLYVIGEQIGGRSVLDFFYSDLSGEKADLREKFKEVSGCFYKDSRFFEVCEERMNAGAV